MKTPRKFLLNRHKSAESKLDRMWNETLAPTVAAVCDRRESRQEHEVGARRAPLQFLACKLWRELVLPSRRIWAGLACAWVVIAVLNVASSEPAMEAAGQTKPPSREEMRALLEQRQMLAQLIGPLSEPAYTHNKRTVPGPHSQRTTQTAAA